MPDQSDIKSLDFEWIVYRKGSLHAHFQLEQKYMTWHDSAQWCNNFTRTLSDEQAARIQTLIRASGMTDACPEEDQEDEAETGELTTQPVSWQIKVQTDDAIRQTQGHGRIPDRFIPLKEQIERISHTCLII